MGDPVDPPRPNKPASVRRYGIVFGVALALLAVVLIVAAVAASN